MRSSYNQFSQSQFYHPSFNSALFDGPIRLFFSQDHEAQALKIYFSLTRDHGPLVDFCRQVHKLTGQIVMVLLYPDQNSFQISFPAIKSNWSWNTLDEDHVVGVCGPLSDELLAPFVETISAHLKTWKLDTLASPDPQRPAELSL